MAEEDDSEGESNDANGNESGADADGTDQTDESSEQASTDDDDDGDNGDGSEKTAADDSDTDGDADDEQNGDTNDAPNNGNGEDDANDEADETDGDETDTGDSGTLTVEVVDGETDEPIEGADVGGIGDRHPSGGDMLMGGQTDADGVMSEEVYESTYDTSIGAEGYESITVEEDLTIDIELAPEDDGTDDAGTADDQSALAIPA